MADRKSRLLCGCGEKDADSDGDTVLDCRHNCTDEPSAGQAESDNNNVGDACEGNGDLCGTIAGKSETESVMSNILVILMPALVGFTAY